MYICDIDCRKVTGLSGVIESANFPDPYPHNRNCTWEIEVPKGNKINASFSHFEMEDPHHSTGDCLFDFLKMWESDQSEQSANNDLGTFCGFNHPGLISTNLDRLSVQFVSDRSVALNGFRLEWVINGCGGIIRKNSGSFTSPNYPNVYPTSVICEWKIETDPGTKIEFIIEDFDLEGSRACKYDALNVYAGPDDTSPLLTQLCHKSVRNVTVNSMGNHIFVRFKSDASIRGKGFKASFSSKTGGCGGRMTGNFLKF